METVTRPEIVEELERLLNLFKAAVLPENVLSQHLVTHGSTTGFANGWAPLGDRFPLLSYMNATAAKASAKDLFLRGPFVRHGLCLQYVVHILSAPHATVSTNCGEKK